MFRKLVLLLALTAPACGGNAEVPASGSAAAQPATTTAAVTGTALRGAVVTLSAVGEGAYPLPPGPAVMDQISKQFVPEVLIVRAGQPVEFRNSEEMEHNVIVVKTPTGRGIFNESPSPFEKYVHTFDEPGVYAVSCDIHPGMRATVVVTMTPHAVLADQSGAFQFSDIQPGRYTLTVMSDTGTVERTIEVAAPRTEVDARGR